MQGKFLIPFFSCFGLLLIAQSTSVPDLKTHYEGKILTLHHAFRSNSQHYDSQGNPVKPGKEGPWTLYSRIQVTDIKLHNDVLEIRGRRTGLLNQNGCLSDYGLNKSPLYLPDPIGTVATIRIQIAPGENPEAAMGKVFALNQQDLLASVPDLWKGYVRTRLDPSSHDGQWEFTPGQAKEARFAELSRTKLVAAHSSAGHNAPGVTPPKPIYTPSPDYGGQIGRALVRGLDIFVTTIDENGNVTAPAIISPIGLGVDESAAETIVKKWKFEPGQLNGKRVPVNMTLEVEYKRDR
jgi:hypothetical protein